MRSLLLKAVPAVLAWACVSIPAFAQERNLESELTRIAVWIEKQVEVKAEKLQRKKEVVLRTVTNTEHCNIDAQVQRSLVRILEQRKITVNAQARLRLEVQYSAVKLTDVRQVGLGLDFSLIDNQTMKILIDFPRAGLVTQTDEVVPAIGITGTLPSTGTQEEVQRRVWQLLDEKVVTGPGGTFADEDRVFGMEILVKQGDKYVPRDAKVREDLAFVALEEKEVYAVRLINNADHEVAVTLTLDGLNLFTFAAAKDYPVVLVPARKAVTIHGWPMSLKKSSQFRITHYCDSAIKEVGGNPKNTGVIVASFAAAWKKGEAPPKGENARSLPTIATGRGEQVDTPFEEIQRLIGRQRAVVSVRYVR